MRVVFWPCIVLIGLMVACRGEPRPMPAIAAATVEVPTATVSPADTTAAVSTVPVPTIVRATAVPTPAPGPTLVPTAQPTAHPLSAYTIAAFRAREFPGGQIRNRGVLEETDDFTRHYIDYPSDGLTITGIMHVPTGAGPFPVLILLHGYVDRDRYFAGLDTWQAAERFAQQGYLVVAPDLRSWGQSDTALSFFHMGLVADVLNLIGSLATLPDADSTRIGLWGHSMGGGIATKVLTIDHRVQAAVLYAPNSADDADLIARWGPGCLPGQEQSVDAACNPGEILPVGTPPELVAAYLAAAKDPDFLRQVAPIYHLDSVSAGVQIHSGTADGEFLEETPPSWAAKLADGFVGAGRNVAYFSYPDQGHYFLGESWSVLLGRALEFFDALLSTAP